MLILPGFLGQPLPVKGEVVSYHNPIPMKKWAEQFAIAGDTVLGYSLGGRLALHLAAYHPRPWRRMIIVSADPGLQEGHQARLEADQCWAHRFRTEPWNQVMEAWNNQPVFAASQRLMREEHEREHWAEILEMWSVAKQEDFREKCAHWSFPILWMSSTDNPGLTFSHPVSHYVKIPDVGHRIPWDQPHLFQEQLDHFLRIT